MEWTVHTQSLPPNLPALIANLLPIPSVHLFIPITKLPSQGNDLSNHQLSNTSRITEWRVEDNDSVLCSVVEVNLVGTDTEASNSKQVLCLLEDLLRQFCLGADTNDMDISALMSHQPNSFSIAALPGISGHHSPNLLTQRIPSQRALQKFHLIPLISQDLLRSLIDILQQQNFDILRRKPLQLLARQPALVRSTPVPI